MDDKTFNSSGTETNDEDDDGEGVLFLCFYD